jgi:hypothetical protein
MLAAVCEALNITIHNRVVIGKSFPNVMAADCLPFRLQLVEAEILQMSSDQCA